MKIGDRVKIVVPTDKDKRVLQENYFTGYKHSPVGDTGVITYDQGSTANDGQWWSVKLDKPAETANGRSVYGAMGFPECELELIDE